LLNRTEKSLKKEAVFPLIENVQNNHKLNHSKASQKFHKVSKTTLSSIETLQRELIALNNFFSSICLVAIKKRTEKVSTSYNV
jgi:hypothetical protein